MEVTYENVLEDVIARDERDRNRSTAPMKPAEDAVIVDTSYLSIQDVIDEVVPLVEAKLNKLG